MPDKHAKEGVLKSYFFRFFVIFGFFAVGYSMISNTSKKFSINRDPAAVRQVYDFSHLRGSALEVAIKERMVSGLEVVRDEGHVGVSLGHFAFTNGAGERTLGCREYGKVVLVFEAEGMVVNGERPKMEVEGACEFSDDLARVNPLTIPIQRILGERPADGEFQFREGKDVAVRFSNLSDEWPRKWLLTGVKFGGAKGDIGVDRGELAKILGHNVLVSFE